MVRRKPDRHLLRYDGILVRGHRKQKSAAPGFHLPLNVGEAGHNSLEIAVGQSDPRIVVQGGAVIKLPVRAQDDLLFRRTVQELFIEKRSGRDQIGTERKTGAHIVCHIGENVRIDHPFPVQERRSAWCTLVGKKRRGTEHQHAQRRDQAEQKEQPDE